MRTRKHTLLLLAGLALAASLAQAAPVSWTTGQFTAETDVVDDTTNVGGKTYPNLLEALNFNGDDNADHSEYDVTANGVLFSGFGNETGDAAFVNPSGAYFSTDTTKINTYTKDNFTDATPGAAVEALLGNFLYNAGSTLTLSGLVPGEDYLVQVFMGDQRAQTNTAKHEWLKLDGATWDTGTDTPVYRDATGTAAGVWATGTFTADANTQVISLVKWQTGADETKGTSDDVVKNLHLDAYQLRGPADTTPPPTPGFAVAPTVSPAGITMTATLVVDPEGNGVQYRFFETSGNPGGDNSAWQDSPIYEDTGLDPSTTYTYYVRARDKSPGKNQSGNSAEASATTPAATGTLAQGTFHILGSFESPTANRDFKVSVFGGNAGFKGQGNVDGATVNVDESINGTIHDYSFFHTNPADDTSAVSYASSGSGLISAITTTPTAAAHADTDWLDLWTTTDPGVGYATMPDHDTGTVLTALAKASGSIDISSLDSGSVYFFYGAYAVTPEIDLSLIDADGAVSAVHLMDAGNDDDADKSEVYVCRIDFSDPMSDYETLTWTFTTSEAGNGNRLGRLAGVVLGEMAAGDYETWAAIYSPADLSDRDGDHDGDGLSNDEERTWGLDPTDPSSVSPISDAGVGTLSYTRRDPTLTGLNYSVWTSTTLEPGSWTEDTGAAVTPGTPDPTTGSQSVDVTLSASPLGGKLFAQVRAAE